MKDELLTLHELKNCTRPKKRRKLLGRGPGSKRGKTCCRGVKGAGSRSGWKARYGAEGGGTALYRRIPARGFTRGRFLKPFDIINLDEIETLFTSGETVSEATLREKGFIRGASYGVKVLGRGSLTIKVKFDGCAISEKASGKLKEAKIL